MNVGEILKELGLLFGKENIFTDSQTLREKSLDLWPRNLFLQKKNFPAASVVVRPARNFNEQLKNLVGLADQFGQKIITRGGGSGVCGAANCQGGEIVIDMSRLCRVAVMTGPKKDQDGLVLAEAGVYGSKLENTLRPLGLTHGHYPASLAISTVGGWTQTRSSGHYSCYLGNIESLVMAIEGVNGKGELLCLEGEGLEKTFRMEGASLITTQVWLKTFKIPANDFFQTFKFTNLDDLVAFLRGLTEIRKQLDERGVKLLAVRAYDLIDYKFMSKPYKGDSHKPAWLERTNYFVEKRLCGLGGTIEWATDILERRGALSWVVVVYFASDFASELITAKEIIEKEARLYSGESLGPSIAHSWYTNRFKLDYEKLVRRFRAGITVDTFECSPKWDKLAEVYRKVRHRLFEFGMVGAHIGLDLDRPYIYFIFGIPGRKRERYDEAWQDILFECIKNGVNLTHHHGIGKSKAGRENILVPYCYGREWFDRACSYKKELDPHNILNPGNIF